MNTSIPFRYQWNTGASVNPFPVTDNVVEKLPPNVTVCVPLIVLVVAENARAGRTRTRGKG